MKYLRQAIVTVPVGAGRTSPDPRGLDPDTYNPKYENIQEKEHRFHRLIIVHERMIVKNVLPSNTAPQEPLR
jgi:hypothetical protein